jgi:succinyl-diaminopimelate desuccinylase
VTGSRGPVDLRERLVERTLTLVAIPSESREEAAILVHLREEMGGVDLELVDMDDSVALFVPSIRRPEAPFVLLAGHVDTVPQGGAAAPARDEGGLVGRGAADMKGGLAVMIEIAAAIEAGVGSDLDVGYLFFGREELPSGHSALLPLFDRCPAAAAADLAIVLEPTGNAIEVGCLGNLNVVVTARGVAAHTARPWLGDNAIHRAITALGGLAELPVRDVEIDGLVYREVMNVTGISGGVATNVLPDLAEASVNYRYAPDRTPEEAETRIRELLAGHEVEVRVEGNAPPGPVTLSNDLVGRLRDRGGLSVGPKQAWTPVAEFAAAGVDAVNFGPGDPRYAHRDDERLDAGALVRAFEVLMAFLAPGAARTPGGTREA